MFVSISCTGSTIRYGYYYPIIRPDKTLGLSWPPNCLYLPLIGILHCPSLAADPGEAPRPSGHGTQEVSIPPGEKWFLGQSRHPVWVFRKRPPAQGTEIRAVKKTLELQLPIFNFDKTGPYQLGMTSFTGPASLDLVVITKFQNLVSKLSQKLTPVAV